MVPCGAECQADGKSRAAGKIEPASQSDVAVKSRFVLPVEPIVVRQVCPAIVHTHITAGTICEGNGGAQREPSIAFMGDQKCLPPYLQHLSIVVPASDVKVGCQKDIHPQPRQQIRRGLQPGVNEKTVLMRVAKNRLVDGIAAFLLAVGDVKTERRLRNAVDLPDKVSALIVEKAFAIGD